MKIDSNLSILRNLMSSRQKLGDSFQRLASGSRLSAKNDPAGLAIAEGLSSQVRSLNIENRNISYEQANLRTQEGSLSGVSGDLQRLRELAVQSSNGTLSDADRANLQTEFDQIVQNIDSNDQVSSVSLGISDQGVASQSGAEDALEAIDNAISEVSSLRAEQGAQANALEYRSNANAIQAENLAAARSQIADIDYAEEISELQRLKFLQEAQVQTLKADIKSKKNTLSIFNSK